MYQLTINAPKEKGWTHEHILEVMRGNFKTLVYICMADEQGSCYHTHIFVVFVSRVRFSMVKRYFEEAHIEKCKGSVSDNVNYVKKTGKWETDETKQEKRIEGTFEEYGAQPPDSKGKRSDMSELYQMVMDNCKQQVFSSIFRQFISSRFRQSKTSISYSLFIPGDCSPGFHLCY